MNFKKIISAVIASATLLAGTAFPVSASDYDPCDVDRNGYVNIGDLVYLNKYLLGGYSVTNYNQLDVNQSLTVDDADRKCLTTILLGEDSFSWGYFSRKTGNIVSPTNVSGFTPSNSSSSSAGKTYMRYRYDNNGQPTQKLSDYTLTPTLMTLNGGASPRVVIGEDDRKISCNPENSGIVLIDSVGGTGFIVGDHQIATAAHCVYVNDEWRPIRIKTYDSNGCVTDNTLHPVEAHVPKSCVSGGPTEDDYAMITVSEDLSEYVQFSLGTPYNVSKSAYSNIPVYLTGCPGETSNGGNSSRNLYSAEGNVVANVLITQDVLCYDVDMSGGDSGAPVYTISKIGSEYVYTAIAINSVQYTYGPNAGPMITNRHLQFYKNNPNASYS